MSSWSLLFLDRIRLTWYDCIGDNRSSYLTELVYYDALGIISDLDDLHILEI